MVGKSRLEAALDYVIRQATDFGKAVGEFRALRDCSQSSLAEQLGVHRSYLSALEQGHVTAAVERLLAAFTALDLEVVVRSRP